MTRSNYFQSDDLNKWSMITYYLFLITLNGSESDVIPFTFHVGYAPNHITENMIGYAQT